MRKPSSIISVIADLEDARGRAFVQRLELAFDEDHSFCRGVAMRREHISRTHPRKDIGIGLAGIAVEDSDLTGTGEDWRASPQAGPGSETLIARGLLPGLAKAASPQSAAVKLMDAIANRMRCMTVSL